MYWLKKITYWSIINDSNGQKIDVKAWWWGNEIKNAWEELKTGEYDNYYSNHYDLGGIKINYSIQELNNGEFRFRINTHLDK